MLAQTWVWKTPSQGLTGQNINSRLVVRYVNTGKEGEGCPWV